MSDYLTESIDKFVRFMKQENLSDRTIDSYVYVVKKLSENESRLYRFSDKQIQDFILQSASASAQDLKINAIQKFYKVNHPTRRIKVFIRPRKPKKQIVVLSKNEVSTLFKSIYNIKHLAIAQGLYYHGLRRSELINLKYEHIDRDRNVLFIKDAKGRKDRFVPLNNVWVETLKQHAKKEKHGSVYTGYIFTGQFGEQYSETSVYNIVKTAAKKAAIRKNVYPHLLRDCYATHLMESGIDSRIIQEILGHSNIKTTQKYLHPSLVSYSNLIFNLAV